MSPPISGSDPVTSFAIVTGTPLHRSFRLWPNNRQMRWLACPTQSPDKHAFGVDDESQHAFGMNDCTGWPLWIVFTWQDSSALGGRIECIRH
jgi:hypothetical protein